MTRSGIIPAVGDAGVALAAALAGAGAGAAVAALAVLARCRADERARSLFLAAATHKIKTPLTVVNGYAHTLHGRWERMSAEDRDRALAAIARRSESLTALADQLLSGFRAEAGELHIRTLDLGPLLEAAAKSFQAVSSRHAIEVGLPEWLPSVLGDAAAVGQMVDELVENAIKYRPGGGLIRLWARAEGRWVTAGVTDQGVGLAEGDVDRVFGSYYRSASTEDEFERAGTGLGLYIVRQLAEAQGGTVRASGSPGAGTTVYFSLPAAGPAPSSAPRRVEQIL